MPIHENIDKQTLKIFKFIYRKTNYFRKKGATEKMLQKKFPQIGISLFLMIYINNNFLLGQDEDGNYFTECPVPFHSNGNYRYYTTNPSNKLVEEHQKSKYLFWVPYLLTTFIAVTNLFITIITHKSEIIEFFKALFN